MRPKNKFQRKAVELSGKLKPLTSSHTQWAFKKVLSHYIYVNQKENQCLSCNHKWTGKSRCRCPNCGMKLISLPERKRSHKTQDYFCVIDKIQEFQVLRYFQVEYKVKQNTKPYLHFIEVTQHWISPKGERCIVSYLRLFSYTGELWSFREREVRADMDKYHFHCDLYPYVKLIDFVKRNGFDKKLSYSNFSNMIVAILVHTKAETLIKSKQEALIKSYFYYQRHIEQYWQQIKICIRNNYKIEDPQIWFDHMRTLTFLGMDINNPKHICHPDIDKEHVRLVEKIREKNRKENLLKLKSKILEENKLYLKEKKKYLNINLVEGNITIIPLQNVEEFYTEGDIMGHCVFENEYYKKENSLILSAKVGKERCATIEMSIPDIRLKACRGFKNNTPERYHEIVNLINNNLKTIKKQINATGRSKRKSGRNNVAACQV